MWPKLRASSRSSRGKPSKEQQPNVGSKLNVNEEYMEALRTKSYIEIWSKVHGQFGSSHAKEEIPFSPLHPYMHIYESLLEPQQEALTAIINKSRLHTLLIDYFHGSFEAFNLCTFLLEKINQTRTNYSIIKRVLKLAKRVSENYTEAECRFMLSELASFSDLENPLAPSTELHFAHLHDLYLSMRQKLAAKRKRVLKRDRLIGVFKKASGVSLVIVCGLLSVATITVTAHTVVGILAVPVILASSSVFLKKKKKKELIRSRDGRKESGLARLGAQLDAAAKGAYTLYRDFETMSRLARRLHDEIEHRKAVIRMCLKSGKWGLLKEVVKEFESEECGFLEQLEELEEHIYLCFLTINRARRLVIQEI